VKHVTVDGKAQSLRVGHDGRLRIVVPVNWPVGSVVTIR